MKATVAIVLLLAAVLFSFPHFLNADETDTDARSRLTELQVERDRNAAMLGASHPVVKSLDAEIAAAEARSKSASKSVTAKAAEKISFLSLSGTYLVTFGPDANGMKALVNPSVVAIGDRKFLSGTVSGKVGVILEENAFSGSPAYVALDSIITIQKVQ